MSERQTQTKKRRRRPRTPLTAGLCVVAASVLGAGLVADAVGTADTISTTTAEAFTSIDPIRLLDTRSDVAAEVPDIPWSATSIAIDVTMPGSAGETSFTTVWPIDSAHTHAHIDGADASEHDPSQAIASLVDSAIEGFNEAGETDIIIDIVGYYGPMPSVGVLGG